MTKISEPFIIRFYNCGRSEKEHVIRKKNHFEVMWLLILIPVSVQTDLCDTSNYWTHYGSHCYKVYNTSLSWEDAA